MTTTTPNRFELGCPGTAITYSTSSFAGPPQLSYKGPKGDEQLSGEEISTATTALGTEVTVTLEEIPDLRVVTLTLVVPDIEIERGGELEFDTLAIFTTNHTTIAGPPPVHQSYEAIELHGMAQLVDF